MSDTKIVHAAQDAAAALSLNSTAVATARPTLGSSSAPATPHHGPSAPVPQLSPTPAGGGRTGRRLHTKVLEELKNAATRKSPAINPNAAPSGHAAAPLPSPLNLQSLSSSDALSDASSMVDGVSMDGSSPRIPAPLNGGKSKTCGICDRSFTVFRAKHTCKVCGRKICDDCSKNRVKLNRRLERRRGSRLCDNCARDHIQLSTPLVSPTQPHIPEGEEEHDGTDDSSRSQSGIPSTKATGSSTGEKGKLQDRLQRAVSTITSSSSAVFPTDANSPKTGDSFLRPRHWISLLVVTCLLAARLLRSPYHGVLMAEARGLVFLLLSLTHWIDHVASLRVIGPYLLGLVIYDEVTARRSPHYNTVVSSTVPVIRRSRTRSAISESTRRTVLSADKSIPAGTSSLRGPHEQDDENLEVQVGDKSAEEEDGFSLDKLHEALNECTTKNRSPETGEMKMIGFLLACDNVCGFVLVFGRATAFAASTVTGYMSTIATNLAAWPLPAGASAMFSWKEQTVRAVVEHEVELHVAATGGKKKPSCSRCVLRLLWFIEFVEAYVRYTLLENTDDNCQPGASKAYEETIGARHPWIIRKGVNSALASLPTRSAIIKALNLHELSPEECHAQLKKVQTSMRSVIDEVTALLKEHQLQDIK